MSWFSNFLSTSKRRTLPKETQESLLQRQENLFEVNSESLAGCYFASTLSVALRFRQR